MGKLYFVQLAFCPCCILSYLYFVVVVFWHCLDSIGSKSGSEKQWVKNGKIKKLLNSMLLLRNLEGHGNLELSVQLSNLQVMGR